MAKSQVQPAGKRRVLVTISKETTYITEPLRKDGYVDYVAALDQRFRRGVTPENNAAVLFWQAMGPREINPQHRDEYFKMLGIPPLPEKGDYYVPLDEYAEGREGRRETRRRRIGTRAVGRAWEQLSRP